MGSELKVLKWPNFFPVEPANRYSKRCFTDKVRSSLQRGSNIKAMVRGSENLAHSCPETTRNKICSIFLRQREMSESHTLLDRQQGSLVLLSERQQCSLVFSFEDGRKKNRKNWGNKYEQRDLVLSSKSQYVYHNRLPVFSTEYSSRQGIKEKTRLFRAAS